MTRSTRVPNLALKVRGTGNICSEYCKSKAKPWQLTENSELPVAIIKLTTKDYDPHQGQKFQWIIPKSSKTHHVINAPSLNQDKKTGE